MLQSRFEMYMQWRFRSNIDFIVLPISGTWNCSEIFFFLIWHARLNWCANPVRRKWFQNAYPHLPFIDQINRSSLKELPSFAGTVLLFWYLPVKNIYLSSGNRAQTCVSLGKWFVLMDSSTTEHQASYGDMWPRISRSGTWWSQAALSPLHSWYQTCPFKSTQQQKFQFYKVRSL